MRIGVDLDDTLSVMKEAFDIEICQHARKLGKHPDYQKMQQLHKDPCAKHIYSTCCDMTQDELQKYFFYFHQEVSRKVPARENCAMVLQKLKDEGDTIIVITAREKASHPDIEKITKDWLDDHHIPYDKCVLNACNKGKIAREEEIDLLIDDNLNNCKEVEDAGIPAIKFCNLTLENATNNWLEVYEIIKNMKK